MSDALRADALDCYGGEAATPNLCALAARGVLFERAYANAPWTLPSSVAMMTGSHPGQFRRESEEPTKIEAYYYVPDEERLLAEAVRDLGFEVECVLENGLAGRANTMQGFVKRRFGRKRNRKIQERFADRLALEPRDERYRRVLWLVDFFFDPQRGKFFLLHWIDDPHAAYQPPRELRDRLQAESAELPRPLEYYLGLGHHHRPERGLRKLRSEVPDLSPEEIAFLKRLYLLEVESVDERIGLILAALDESGRAEDTIVLFISDHGEGFGEHGRFLHGDSLYQELVHVPLIMAGPGIAPLRRVASAVSHADLMPTLAALLGVSLDADVQGRSLMPALAAGRLDRRPVYLESPDRLEHDGLVAGGRKILAGTGDQPVELYDLEADPGERYDLSAEEPDVVERMMAMLETVRDDNDMRRAARAAVDPAVLTKASEEIRKQMEALGYLD